jgi:hypothetical protein
MNGFTEVRVSSEDRKNLKIELIPELDPDAYETITIPEYLIDDFRDQIQHLFGF